MKYTDEMYYLNQTINHVCYPVSEFPNCVLQNISSMDTTFLKEVLGSYSLGNVELKELTMEYFTPDLLKDIAMIILMLLCQY